MENVTGFAEKLNMNIIAGGEEPESNPFYKDGKINVGNTNGKVILQTFSLQSLTSRMRPI